MFVSLEFKTIIWIHLLCFWTLSFILSFYLKQRFGDWTLSLFSGKKSDQSGPISRASPHLQTSEPTQGRKYKPNTT
jgi:hypothetical protein